MNSSYDTTLTEAVRGYAHDLGADLVGFGNPERWADAPERLRPESHLPGARGVVAMAVHHPDASVELAGIPYPNYMGPFQIGQTSKLESLSYLVARFLNQRGYEAMPYPATRYWWHRRHKELENTHTASFSNRHAAAACGLGEFGWNNLFMSPQYGPRQRVVSVITSASLEPTPLYNGPALCDKCMMCVKECPGHTFERELLEPKVDRFTIEGKVFEYAKLNRWRCIWGEQFKLAPEELPDSVDENVVLEACRNRERVGLESGACLRVCMAGTRRDTDKGNRPVFRRKKDFTPRDLTSGEYLLARMRETAARRGALELQAVSLESLSDSPVNVPDGYPWNDIRDEFASLVLVRYPRPSQPRFFAGTDAGNHAERFISFALCNETTNLRWELAALADDLGFEAMCTWDDIDPFVRDAKKLLGWEEDAHTGWFVHGGVLTTADIGELPAMRATPSSTVFRITPSRDLTDAVLSDAQCRGCDVAGIGTVGRLRELECADGLPPECNDEWRVVAFGHSFADCTVNQAGAPPAETVVPYAFSQFQMMREIMVAGNVLCRRLSDNGYDAYLIADFSGGTDQVTSTRMNLPSLHANALVGYAAGLGEIGRSGLLLTPHHGPRQRIAGILTNAPLRVDDLYQGPALCTQCNACVDACPTHALNATRDIHCGDTRRETADRHLARCQWSIRYGLCPEEGPCYMGWQPKEVVPVPDEPTEEDIAAALALKDPLQVDGYDDPCHTDTILEACMAVCPCGRAQAGGNA